MQTMGLNTVDILVLPAIIGLVKALPRGPDIFISERQSA